MKEGMGEDKPPMPSEMEAAIMRDLQEQGSMAFELSKKEIVKEIVKSGKDPIYFINNYCRISHPQRGLIKFDTFPYQDDLLQDFNDFRFTVILKARQLGISTITAAYIVWLINFHRDKNVMVLATKFATAANLVKKKLKT